MPGYSNKAPAAGLALLVLVLSSQPLTAQSPGGPGAGQEIAVLRYLKIRKGSFPEVHRLSVEGVWPCYERAGARIVAMWQVIYPDMPGQVAKPSAEYDEAYLLTRYASVAHWQATRNQVLDAFCDGSDLTNMRASLKQRAALTLESSITVLSGTLAANGPYLHVPARTVR
jgi:hypothetical protein